MRMTILIVDDDINLLEVFSYALREAGFSTFTATNGVDALKLARSRSPDLIVLDFIMPQMDGLTVCETLRRGRATAGIPIILLTGWAGQLGRFAAMGQGANDYIMKPVTPEHLVSRVELLLRASAASEARECAPTRQRIPPVEHEFSER